METITFKCRFITPAFLGGPNPKETPELRPPSIKGALRFWWRAQSGISDLKKLKKRELEIFGGIDGDRARKSSFFLRTSHEEFFTNRVLPDNKTDVRNKHYKVNIFEYLAYGTYDYDKEKKANVLNRDFIVHGQKFEIHFGFYSSSYKKEVLSAFELLSLFGGIGSKSRNGYGRFELIDIPKSIVWENVLQNLKQGDKKSYTSFSKEIKCFQTEDVFDDPLIALSQIGKAYKNAREYIEKPHTYEDRSYLASPIVERKKQRSFLDRHAKSYFLTVVPENGPFRGLILFLPYLFLEDAQEMIQGLLREKEKIRKASDMPIHELKEYLVGRPIKKHQQHYNDSNGYFHEELCHVENNYALTQVAL